MKRTIPGLSRTASREEELPSGEYLVEVSAEASDLLYFKIYKSQLPVIEQALEIAARMLGSDKSRGYCLEMICADFLAGANLEVAIPDGLLCSAKRLCKFLPDARQEKPGSRVDRCMRAKRIRRVRTNRMSTDRSGCTSWSATDGDVNSVGVEPISKFTIGRFAHTYETTQRKIS